MSISNNELPQGVEPPTLPPSQFWTPEWYPIVDGKFHDLATDEIKTHEGRSCPGPPLLRVYWNNCGPLVRQDQFFAKGCWNRLTINEYLARMGEMLREEKCKICSLNATQYAVFVVMETGPSKEDFSRLLYQHGLSAGPEA